MSATNSLHYELCCLAAKYIIQPRAAERFRTPMKWSAVELVCMGCELPDVYALNGEDSAIIEVKTSVADFRNDRKKYTRSEQAEKAGHTMGNFRYYLCPFSIADIIQKELPEHWGLLVWDGKRIERVVSAKYVDTSKKMDMFAVASIMSREIGVHKVFNYRK